MGFKDLKKNSTSMATKLQEELEKNNKSNDYKDDRFWRPTLDSASNGYAVIINNGVTTAYTYTGANITITF